MAITIGAGRPLATKISLTSSAFKHPATQVIECYDPWCELGAICPIASCQGILSPRDKSGHWHSHIEDGYWHNIKKAWYGDGLSVTKVCDWNRSDRRNIPSVELLPSVGIVSVDISNRDRFLAWARGYLWDMVMQPSVQIFLQQHGPSGVLPFKVPEMAIVDTCGDNVGGTALSDTRIRISSWILPDRNQTALVVRHELAHIIVARCKLQDSDHGPWFSAACQAISPLTWESDRHWTTTPAIERARLAHHAKPTRLVA